MSKELANRYSGVVLLLVFLAFAIAILINASNPTPVMAQQHVTQGNPLKAPGLIEEYGCGTCHRIPGVVGANGTVGPELDDLSQRNLLAGQIPNTPDNLVLWI